MDGSKSTVAATRRFRHSAGRAAAVQIQCRLRPDGANPAPTGSGGAFLVPRRQRWCIPIVARTLAWWCGS
ncbi:hypothetical protein M569_11968 [Genlisea aurea]|uniref:Uncharacterized protein n=1 Tax=Genlisea aurea TaxID=192259 RepID=S8C7Q6_9LAMI|nr:hypothetical protein M569_11968 [Genlisea aurea]